MELIQMRKQQHCKSFVMTGQEKLVLVVSVNVALYKHSVFINILFQLSAVGLNLHECFHK